MAFKILDMMSKLIYTIEFLFIHTVHLLWNAYNLGKQTRTQLSPILMPQAQSFLGETKRHKHHTCSALIETAKNHNSQSIKCHFHKLQAILSSLRNVIYDSSFSYPSTHNLSALGDTIFYGSLRHQILTI